MKKMLSLDQTRSMLEGSYHCLVHCLFSDYYLGMHSSVVSTLTGNRSLDFYDFTYPSTVHCHGQGALDPVCLPGTMNVVPVRCKIERVVPSYRECYRPRYTPHWVETASTAVYSVFHACGAKTHFRPRYHSYFHFHLPPPLIVVVTIVAIIHHSLLFLWYDCPLHHWHTQYYRLYCYYCYYYYY